MLFILCCDLLTGRPAHHSVLSYRTQDKASQDKPGQEIEDAALLLFDQARILDGEPVSDVKAFAQRLSKVMEAGLV